MYLGSGCEGVVSPLARVLSMVYVVVGTPLVTLYLFRMGRLTANMVRCVCCTGHNSKRYERDGSIVLKV